MERRCGIKLINQWKKQALSIRGKNMRDQADLSMEVASFFYLWWQDVG